MFVINKSTRDLHKVQCVCVGSGEDSKQGALVQKAVGSHLNHEKPKISLGGISIFICKITIEV